jgi:hypothetical protein
LNKITKQNNIKKIIKKLLKIRNKDDKREARVGRIGYWDIAYKR